MSYKCKQIIKFTNQLPNVSTKATPNEGDRIRISHSAIKSGSLWVKPQASTFKIKATGGVTPLLGLRKMLGKPKGVDMGEEYWDVNSIKQAQEVICRLASLEVNI